jgi:4-amino-4-deoxy-L-arabinose transferase-like glycosyltransferase
MSRRSLLHLCGLVVMAAVLVAPHLVMRPAAPVDETRYLSVAWEMYATGELLVPHLNGAPYSHKPPLLFWLMIAGWSVLGVSTTWARLVGPMAAVSGVLAVGVLARSLWPEHPQRWWGAAWVVAGSMLWIVLAPMVLFDGMLLLWVVSWMAVLVAQEREQRAWRWPTLALLTTLGLLTKGPVMLLYTVPVAACSGCWSRRRLGGSWWLGVASSLGGGVAMAAAWALPAAIAGGGDYARELLWTQTSSRLVAGATDVRPWYWYLVVLPLVLLPWSVWTPLWRALVSLRRGLDDPAVRLSAVWAAPALLVLSLAPSKQPQYLLPLVPAVALIVVAGLDGSQAAPRWWMALLPSAVLGMIAAAPLVVFLVPDVEVPPWVRAVPVAAPLTALGLAGLPLLVPSRGWRRAVVTIAVASVGVVAALSVGVLAAGADAFDLRRPARTVAMHLQQHPQAPVAHGASYHGQLHYFARLRRPVEVIDPESVVSWFADHPSGVVVLYLDRDHPALEYSEEVQPFRTRTVSVWTVGDVRAAEQAGTCPEARGRGPQPQ